MPATISHIHKRRRLWVVRLTVPPDVQGVLGRKLFSWSTGETDAARAAVKADPVLAGWRREIEAARAGHRTVIPEDRLKALKAAWKAGETELVMDAVVGLLPSTVTMDALTRAWEERGRDMGLAIASVAPVLGPVLDQITDKRTPFLEHKAEWVASLDVTQKTRDMYSAELDLWVAGGAEHQHMENVTRFVVQRWVDGRALAGDGAATIQRRLSALRNYWQWCQRHGHVDAERDPWRGVKLPGGGRGRGKGVDNGDTQRQAFTVDEIKALHTSAMAKDDKALADLIWLAAHTGARIEELCQLQVKDVDLGQSGVATPRAIRIVDSKSPAGRRTVPIVGEAVPLVRRLVEAAQGGQWIIHSDADNQYGMRGISLGKRFGRLKTSMGFGPGHVFHSIRKVVATLLHDVGCPEPIAADILGHKIATMSYGVYSAGSSLDTRREWLAKALAPLASAATLRPDGTQ